MHRIRLKYDPVERNSTHLIAIGESAPCQQALASLGKLWSLACLSRTPKKLAHAKRPPGNRAAFSLGRIVPTEAKPSELSGCILSLAKTGVKTKTMPMQHLDNNTLIRTDIIENIRLIFVFNGLENL
jgi:hypothetical protein